MYQNIFLLRIRHMCINFRCADRAMPKHFLDIADIHVLFQEECGEGVAEHVRGDVLFDSGDLGVVIDHKAHGLIGQFAPPFVYKEIAAGGDLLLKEIAVQCYGCDDFGIDDLEDSLFCAFAVDQYGVVFQINVRWF